MPQWSSTQALRCLADRGFQRGMTFTAAELESWLPQGHAPSARQTATTLLSKAGFVEARAMRDPVTLAGWTQYTVTEAGEAAIAEVRNGAALKPGPRGGTAQRDVNPMSVASRLWKLVRIRQVVDSQTTAELLFDAGDPRLERARKQISSYLGCWASQGLMARAKKRLPGGGVRYVLQQDPGPRTPPCVSPPKPRADQGGQA